MGQENRDKVLNLVTETRPSQPNKSVRRVVSIQVIAIYVQATHRIRRVVLCRHWLEANPYGVSEIYRSAHLGLSTAKRSCRCGWENDQAKGLNAHGGTWIMGTMKPGVSGVCEPT